MDLAMVFTTFRLAGGSQPCPLLDILLAQQFISAPGQRRVIAAQVHVRLPGLHYSASWWREEKGGRAAGW
jgi:hypothetical protein